VVALEEAFESLGTIYCASHHLIQVPVLPEFSAKSD
jgi:hypothetical protein